MDRNSETQKEGERDRVRERTKNTEVGAAQQSGSRRTLPKKREAVQKIRIGTG